MNPLLDLPGAAADAPPPALLPYQQRWVADDSPLKIGEKSRRIGWTWGEAADNVLTAAQPRPRGSNVFYISATQDMALEYIEAAAMWARAYDSAAGQIEAGLFDDGEREIKTYRIDFPRSGNRIVALSSRPANLRGKQGVVAIDEGAFAPDLAGLIKAAMAMLLWGDRVHIWSTHNGDANPFNELIQEVRAGKRKGSVHRVTFREAVAEGLFRRVCLRKGIVWTQEREDAWVADAYAFYGADSDEELDVVPSQGGGVYLPMALIEARMDPATTLVRGRWGAEFGLLPEPARRLEVEAWCREHLDPLLARLDRTRPHGFGQDFGRVADLSSICLVEESQDLVRRCRGVVELSHCPFRQQEQILCYLLDRLPRFRSGAMDATGNGAAHAEYAADKYGALRIEQVKITEQVYLESMPRMKAGLEDGTLTSIPRNDELRDDLRAIRVVQGIPKLPKAPTQQADGLKLRRHGDFAVALMLAHRAMTRDVAPIEFTPAPYAGRYRERADDGDAAALRYGGHW